MADTPDLTAVALTCSLKPSPAPSSTDLLAQQLLDALARYGVTGELVRVVDDDVRPGVEADMGAGDAWPRLREKVMEADILVLATPTWMGQHSSVAQRVLERLDAELSDTNDAGQPLDDQDLGRQRRTPCPAVAAERLPRCVTSAGSARTSRPVCGVFGARACAVEQPANRWCINS